MLDAEQAWTQTCTKRAEIKCSTKLGNIIQSPTLYCDRRKRGGNKDMRKLFYNASQEATRKVSSYIGERKVPDRGMNGKVEFLLWPIHNNLDQSKHQVQRSTINKLMKFHTTHLTRCMHL